MKVWISRDKVGESGIYVWRGNPTNDPNNGVFYHGGYIFAMGVKEFKTNFGFTLRKGNCKEYELKIVR